MSFSKSVGQLSATVAPAVTGGLISATSVPLGPTLAVGAGLVGLAALALAHSYPAVSDGDAPVGN